MNKENTAIVARIVDTETTGISSTDQIIELAYINVAALESYPSDLPFYANKFTMFTERYCPSVPIHPQAEALHKIDKAMLVDCRPSEEIELPETEFLIGHNVSFDSRMLGNPKTKLICTLALAKKIWTKDKVINYKLITLIKELVPEGAALISEAHSAYADCQLVSILLHYRLEKLPRVTNWEELYTYQGIVQKKPKEKAPLPEIMPFGKYRGELIKDIPQAYLQWVLSNVPLKPALQMAIKESVDRR